MGYKFLNKTAILGKRSIIESVMSLSIINVLNIGLPLITLPYLVRVIGPERYGVYSFIFVIIQYIVLLSSYGFQFSATKNISQNRTDHKELSVIFNSVIFCKLGIAIVLVMMLGLATYFIGYLRKDYLLVILGFGIVFGDVFTPIWFFQGVEKMRYITIINFISKLVFTLVIFFVVKKADDYVYLTLLNSIGSIVAAILSMYFVRRYFNIKVFIPKFDDLKLQMQQGFHIFLSTIGINLYRNSNIFLLGVFSSEYAVGIYSVAEKIIKSMQSLATPVTEALYPYLSNKFNGQTKKKYFETIVYVSKYLVVFYVLLVAFILLFSPYLVNFFLGEKFSSANVLIRIMSSVVFLGGFGYVFGVLGLFNIGEQKKFLVNVFISGVLGVLVLIVFVSKYNAIAAAVAMVVAELTLFLLCLNSLIKSCRAERL